MREMSESQRATLAPAELPVLHLEHLLLCAAVPLLCLAPMAFRWLLCLARARWGRLGQTTQLPSSPPPLARLNELHDGVPDYRHQRTPLSHSRRGEQGSPQRMGMGMSLLSPLITKQQPAQPRTTSRASPANLGEGMCHVMWVMITPCDAHDVLPNNHPPTSGLQCSRAARRRCRRLAWERHPQPPPQCRPSVGPRQQHRPRLRGAWVL